MAIVDLLGKWFWLLFIGVTFLNGAIYKSRARTHVERNPDLAEGYERIARGFVVWTSLPWIVMGIGCTVGGVPSVLHYFNPRGGNLYVLAFYASLFLLWILGSYWILFQDGAMMLVKHPGLLNPDIKNPLIVKLLWVACVLGGIVAFVMMYAGIIPAPDA